jgi:hypothetical protein
VIVDVLVVLDVEVPPLVVVWDEELCCELADDALLLPLLLAWVVKLDEVLSAREEPAPLGVEIVPIDDVGREDVEEDALPTDLLVPERSCGSRTIAAPAAATIRTTRPRASAALCFNHSALFGVEVIRFVNHGSGRRRGTHQNRKSALSIGDRLATSAWETSA